VTVGVLAMAYGTPASPADVESYYTHIRRGRPPTPEQLADLQRRYDAIGGISPLLEITRAQCGRLQDALGDGFAVQLGQKHAAPFIEDGVESLAVAGVTSIVGLVLAPHYSAFSVGQYADRLAKAAAGHGLPSTTVESWHTLPAYLAFLADAVHDALAEVPDGAEVVFTAHSLPQRITETGDPYPAQVRETAAEVAERRKLTRWSTGWQSAGRTPEPWLGPDILDVVRGRSRAGSPGPRRLPVRLHGRPPRGAVRPRHRGARRRGRGRTPVRAHQVAERRPGRLRRAGRRGTPRVRWSSRLS
jgi:ferrochelatase